MRIKLLLLATLLTVSPLVSLATDYYVATTDLNVRVGAGARYSVSFTLQKGDEVELLSKDSNWYRIGYKGKTGYASSKYLKLRSTSPGSNVDAGSGSQIMNGLLIIAFASTALFFLYFIYVKIRDKKLLHSVTTDNRGTPSERELVLLLLKNGVSKDNLFHDLYVEKRNGEFSQTDLVVVSKVGIIVFEVKEYTGWIFGNGSQPQWTQVFGKQKYYFYNPIMQNNAHIAVLKGRLSRYENIPYYSVIVFYGACEFKSINFVPNGTFIVKASRVLEVLSNILSVNSPCSYTNEGEVIRILREAESNGGKIENQIKHVENIKDMLGTDRVLD